MSTLATNHEKQLATVEANPLEILRMAVEKGANVETLERLTALAERVEDRNAAKEFADAMARFQEHCPPIRKTSTANVMSQRTGSSHSYKYAELDEIARTIRPLLAKEGLSYRWDSTEEGGRLTCVCTVSHINGHTITAKFACGTDTPAAMSAQQKSAAALTYARRQSLIQALGLTTCDPDTDGRVPVAVASETITAHQVANLRAMLDELGGDSEARFLGAMKLPSLADMPASKFEAAIKAIEKKRAERAGRAS